MNKTLTARNVPCQHQMFKGLTDAFSREPLDVRLTVSPRRGVSYYAFINPGRYAPYSHVTYRSPQETMKALTMRGGVTGMVEEEACLLCPYTKDPLTVEKCKGGFRVKGGWNPFIPFKGSPEEYVYNCSMRNGVAPEGISKEAPWVSSVVDETVPPKDNPDAKLKDEFEEKGNDIMDDLEKVVKDQTKVAMSGVELPDKVEAEDHVAARVNPADTPAAPPIGTLVTPVNAEETPVKVEETPVKVAETPVKVNKTHKKGKKTHKKGTKSNKKTGNSGK
jgi:hypothetical protein